MESNQSTVLCTDSNISMYIGTPTLQLARGIICSSVLYIHNVRVVSQNITHDRQLKQVYDYTSPLSTSHLQYDPGDITFRKRWLTIQLRSSSYKQKLFIHIQQLERFHD